MKVCLDAGHGGVDPGAVSGGMVEEDLTLAVVKEAAVLLGRAGAEVVLTRDKDAKVSNAERCRRAKGSDVFVAVHYNAAESKARGHEVIYTPKDPESKRLAQCIHDSVTALGFKSRGIKTDTATGRGPFTVLRNTKMPAVIVEVLFLTNAEDRALTDEPHEVAQIAEAVVQGTLTYFGKEDGTMSDELKAAVKNTLNGWDQLKEIFRDGKVAPAEVPLLLRAVVELLQLLSNLLVLVKVDAKVSAILTVVVKVLESIAEEIDSQLPKIEAGWAKVKDVMKDDKVQVNEIPLLLDGIVDLIEAGMAIALPFITPEFTEAGASLAKKIQKVLGWLKFIPGVKPPASDNRKPTGGGLGA